jgi:hypothetical protein
MEYVIGVAVALFIAYKVAVHFGRKSAKDFLVTNYGVDKRKLDLLRDVDITRLTISLESFARKGDNESLSNLVEQFK